MNQSSRSGDSPEQAAMPVREFEVVKATQGPYQEYNVLWQMTVPATSPEEAARAARVYQRDEKRSVGAFEVYDEAGNAYRVDLDELDGVSL